MVGLREGHSCGLTGKGATNWLPPSRPRSSTLPARSIVCKLLILIPPLVWVGPWYGEWVDTYWLVWGGKSLICGVVGGGVWLGIDCWRVK